MRLAEVFRSWRIAGGTVVAELFGGLALQGPKYGILSTLTYGPAIALNAALGNDFTVTVTDAVAFAFSAPTNTPPTGMDQIITIRIRNAAGAPHGAGTFNAIFLTSGAVPAIANGFSRAFCFRWNGTNWVELWRSAADVAN